MVLHPGKKAIRALGVAESFRPASKQSTLSGVVMRSDLVVDGFVIGHATVGGTDGTASILRMFRKLKRADINLIILSGCVISRYNIVDLDGLSSRSELPVICLTYNETRGLEEAIRRNFQHPEARLDSYRRLGKRSPIVLHTGYRAYVRNAGISDRDSKRVLDDYTLQGAIPEPVRVARLLARAVSART